MHWSSVESKSAARSGAEALEAFLSAKSEKGELAESLKWALEELVVFDGALFRVVCEKWLPKVEDRCSALSGASMAAGSKGSPEICAYVLEQGGDREKMLEAAASQGNLSILGALSPASPQELARCLGQALRRGNLDAARALVENGARWQDGPEEVFDGAAKGGEAALDFALGLGIDPRGLGWKACRQAVVLGDVKLLRRLSKLGVDVSQAQNKLQCMLTLVRTGNMEMLAWMAETGLAPPTREEMDEARSWNIKLGGTAWRALEAWSEKGVLDSAAAPAPAGQRRAI